MVERNQTNKTNKKNIKAIKDTIKLVNTSEESEEVKQLKARIAELEKRAVLQISGECIFKKAGCLNAGKETESTRAKTQIITALRQEYDLDILLTISDTKRSTYYYNLEQLNSVDKYAAVKTAILDIYEKSNKTYGYPRITEELKKIGYKYNQKTIYKLMKE